MNCRSESPAVLGVAVMGGGRECTADSGVPLVDASMKAAARVITGGTFDLATRRGEGV